VEAVQELKKGIYYPLEFAMFIKGRRCFPIASNSSKKSNTGRSLAKSKTFRRLAAVSPKYDETTASKRTVARGDKGMREPPPRPLSCRNLAVRRKQLAHWADAVRTE
jgi:hypothetical protein